MCVRDILKVYLDYRFLAGQVVQRLKSLVPGSPLMESNDCVHNFVGDLEIQFKRFPHSVSNYFMYLICYNYLYFDMQVSIFAI